MRRVETWGKERDEVKSLDFYLIVSILRELRGAHENLDIPCFEINDAGPSISNGCCNCITRNGHDSCSHEEDNARKRDNSLPCLERVHSG